MDLGALLTTVFGITTVIAAGLAGLVYGGQKTLRESNSDLRSRVTDLEKERSELKAEVAEVKADNASLSRLVTGEVHWQALTEMLEGHHQDAKKNWQKLANLDEAARQHWTKELMLWQQLIEKLDRS